MRRYVLYLAVALLTLGIGWLVSFKFYQSTGQTPKVEETVKTETNLRKENFVEDDDSNLSSGKDEPRFPCMRAKPDDSEPWVYEAKVLDSFPPDNPLPRYLGTFRDKGWDYQLILYQDKNGVFGELLSPVLEADSPSWVIYDAAFDAKSGKLKFSATIRGEKFQFDGILRGRKVKTTVTGYKTNEKIVLKRIKWHYDEYPEGMYKSRAEFDCAMFLYRRAE